MTDDPLHQLYPWDDPAHVTDNTRLLGELKAATLAKSAASAQVQQAFLEAQTDTLLAAAQALAHSFAAGGQLFTMGNGGSACDAAHVAVEFNHPVTAGRRALPAINLSADVAMLTAVGNDVGFERVFARQLQARARPVDALIGISTSGNSPNLLTAFAVAAELGMTTIGLSGGDGGAIASAGTVQYCLTVPSDSVHRIQEAHLVAYHILWELVHGALGGR